MIQLVSAGPDAAGWPVTRRRIRAFRDVLRPKAAVRVCDHGRGGLARLDLDLGGPSGHELPDERPVSTVAEDVELDREAVRLERDRAHATARPDEGEPLVVDDRVGQELGQLGVDPEPRQALAAGVDERLGHRVGDRGDPPQLGEEQVVAIGRAHRTSPRSKAASRGSRRSRSRQRWRVGPIAPIGIPRAAETSW